MKYLIGLAAGITLTLLATGELVLNSQDALARVQEQYAGCKNIGDYPTSADVLPDETNQ